MKPPIDGVKLILRLCLFIIVLIWMMFHASGHDIPYKTNLVYGSLAVALLGLNITYILKETKSA